MEYSFRIKYDTGTREFDGLDMYYGAKSLAAISEFLLLSIHAFLKEEIILQAPAAKGFKMVLQRASIGSYDQIIQMIITDSQTVSLMTDLGKNGLYDLLKYMLCSLLGIPFVLNNRKAKKKLNSLMQQNEDLHKRLESALISAHLPVKHQGYSTVMMLGRTPIIKLDETTLSYLETEIVDPDSEVIPVAVSRFNARTGTGRFIEDIDSISHGFSPINDLNDYEKEIMADNLGKVARGIFEPLNAIVTRVTSQDGVLKRFQLHGISDA
ncbi:hypothetical protein KAM448_23420 [Aeromonas caviae]|jgi:hypothetical protein|uniref:Uncharacterized protein n=1 Tax=Aeromonas caviae TaxID=648 RepID=A0ABD0BBA5_AERCA|nr:MULTISPECIES: hypothetical protein [Aeromonas]HDX8591060.1 hypothetical protein [Aeromonas dhakensis]UBQ51981.1 hypothetical protein LCH17_07735 [Aeromonas hydrophila]BCR30403.1 hypothetical protein KAM376_34090 [Aeromonas caviae]GJA81512.1 hypothetical protein KAM355_20720 [Aeromonas caviae]GJA99785.1 hypothetical protein KAM359_31930 [Aeromonas caviae]